MAIIADKRCVWGSFYLQYDWPEQSEPASEPPPEITQPRHIVVPVVDISTQEVQSGLRALS
jgi:hypothetical protein